LVANHREGCGLMTKKDIIETVAARCHDKKNHIKTIVETVFDVFIELLAREKRIEVRNFGVFKVKDTPARIGRNPVTREIADVPARRIVQFKAGKMMKEMVAQAGKKKERGSEAARSEKKAEGRVSKSPRR
jgi:nucleoid DNA-binding protein